MQNKNSKSTLNFSYLIRSAEALTQWRPLLLNFLTLLGAGVVFFIGVAFSSKGGGAFSSLFASMMFLFSFAIIAAGFSGAGVMLMDQAKQIPPRSMTDALLYGFFCLPKLLGFFLVLVVGALLMALMGAVIYAVCRLPVLGALVLLLAHPVLVVFAAVLFVSVVWVAIPIFTPAVWDGRTFKESLSLVFESARTNLLQIILMLNVLYVVAAIIGAIVIGGLLVGYSFMSAIAATLMGDMLVGGGGVMSMVVHMLGRDFIGSGGSIAGQIYAFGFSSAIIFSVAIALLTQVLIMGTNLVYLAITEGLDVTATQAKLDRHIDQARQKAKAAQARAMEAAERARQHRPISEPAVAQSVQQEGVPITCPKCGNHTAPDDLFCGGCGHKLK